MKLEGWIECTGSVKAGAYLITHWQIDKVSTVPVIPDASPPRLSFRPNTRRWQTRCSYIAPSLLTQSHGFRYLAIKVPHMPTCTSPSHWVFVTAKGSPAAYQDLGLSRRDWYHFCLLPESNAIASVACCTSVEEMEHKLSSYREYTWLYLFGGVSLVACDLFYVLGWCKSDLYYVSNGLTTIALRRTTMRWS